MTPDALLRVQEATIERLLAGDDLVARMVRGKRIDGVARWMPATIARLRDVGWVDPVFRAFLATREGEASDPFSDARAFEAWLGEHGPRLGGLGEALEEDSARLALMAPGARAWGVCVRGARVFYRIGTRFDEFLWARRRDLHDGTSPPRGGSPEGRPLRPGSRDLSGHADKLRSQGA